MQASSPSSDHSAPAPGLPLRSRLAFGIGDVGPAIAGTARSFFFLYFLTSVAGLGPFAAGALFFVARGWDAVSDPLMGWLIDRTRSRFGRLRPWLLYGALPFGLSFAMLWTVPPLGETGILLYMLAAVVLFSSSSTMISIPHVALTSELSRDYDERTTLSSYRFGFGIAAGLIGGLLFAHLTTAFCADPAQCLQAEERRGYMIAGLSLSLALVLPTLLCFAGVREQPRAITQPALRALPERLAGLLRLPAFRIVAGIQICSLLAAQMTAAVLPFYLSFWMQREDLFATLFPLVQGSTFLFLLLWNYLSRRYGKQLVYTLGMLSWLPVQAGLFLLQPQQANLGLALGALAGAGLAAAYLIPWSMLADVVDLDELQRGERREGSCYGLAIFLQKLGIGLGIFLMGALLAWQGFDETAQLQPQSALLAIRWLIGPVPAMLLLVGILLAWRYPLNRRRHAAVLAELGE